MPKSAGKKPTESDEELLHIEQLGLMSMGRFPKASPSIINPRAITDASTLTIFGN